MSTTQGSEANYNAAAVHSEPSSENVLGGNSVDFQKEMQQPGQSPSEQQLVEPAKKTSNCGGIMNLFKGYVGVGILALPYVFNEGGYLSGIIFLSCLGLVVYYTNILLIRVGDRILEKGETYIDICDKVLPQKLAFVMRIFFLVGCLGACISFVLFFVTFFKHAVGESLPDIAYLGMALCIIIPMSLINDIGRLVKFNVLANGILFLTITTIYIYNFVDIFSNMGDSQGAFNRNKDNMFNVERIPLMIGVGLLAFDAIYIIMGVRDQLKEPQHFTTKVLNFTNLLVALLYITFSTTTVWARGHKMEEITLFAMPDNWYISTLQVSYAFALAISYSLFLLCGSKMLEKQDNCLGKFILNSKSRNITILKRTCLRGFLTLIVLIVAFLVPRFAIALNIFGSISGASLQFFLPLYSYYAVFKNEMPMWQKVVNYFILAIGVGGCILGLYGSISELVNPAEDE